MKRKIFLRGLQGAPFGLAISTLISIIISYAVGDGRYYAVVPELSAVCGSEIYAVILQALCSLLYGATWGSASVIWELERWSLLRQSVAHLAICSLATFPIAYWMRWMAHSAAGVAGYFATFLGIYAIIWAAQYFAIKRRLQQINRRMQEHP